MPLEPVLGGTTMGMKVDTFIALNGMLDVMLDDTDTENVEKEKASAPAGLVDENTRPMPKQGELTIGSIGDGTRDVDFSDADLAVGNTG